MQLSPTGGYVASIQQVAIVKVQCGIVNPKKTT
jgi:hypothetical protein